LDLRSTPWDIITGEAKDLVKGLLMVDPKIRLSAQEALIHPWISQKLPTRPLLRIVISRMTEKRIISKKFSIPMYHGHNSFSYGPGKSD
jgi:calcium-dependent protein kinase